MPACSQQSECVTAVYKSVKKNAARVEAFCGRNVHVCSAWVRRQDWIEHWRKNQLEALSLSFSLIHSLIHCCAQWTQWIPWSRRRRRRRRAADELCARNVNCVACVCLHSDYAMPAPDHPCICVIFESESAICVSCSESIGAKWNISLVWILSLLEHVAELFSNIIFSHMTFLPMSQLIRRIYSMRLCLLFTCGHLFVASAETTECEKEWHE